MKAIEMPGEKLAREQLSHMVTKEQMDLQPVRQTKLNMLADAIEAIEVLEDGSLYLKTKNHLIIESTGNQIMYSKEGEIVVKSKMLHLNPTTPINDIRDSADYIKCIKVDAETLMTNQIKKCES